MEAAVRPQVKQLQELDQLMESLESGRSCTLNSHARQSLKAHCLCSDRTRRNCDSKENQEWVEFESQWVNE